LYGQIPTDLQFTARASGSVGTTNNGKANYSVGVYFYYNIAFGAIANVLGLASWSSGDRVAYDPRPRFTIFEQTGNFAAGTPKRSVDEFRYPRRAIFDGLKVASADDDGAPTLKSQKYQNESWSMPNDRFFPRADTSDGSQSQPDFAAAQLVQCPTGTTGNILLPDFRRKYLVRTSAISLKPIINSGLKLLSISNSAQRRCKSRTIWHQ
jgi:hypothetical protein